MTALIIKLLILICQSKVELFMDTNFQKKAFICRPMLLVVKQHLVSTEFITSRKNDSIIVDGYIGIIINSLTTGILWI